MNQILPPEWAPQWGVMLTWPNPEGDFAECFAEVEANFVAIACAISQYEQVLIGSGGNLEALCQRLLAAGAVAANLNLHAIASNDVWARDHGPLTVVRNGTLVHLDFTFNGWGGKFDARLDNEVTRALAERRALTAPVDTLDFVLEGGGIEVDGAGSLLTTERCLLAPTRNPQFGKSEIEARLKGWFGVEQVLWLRHGDLQGDDTDGHIDTIARYCDERTIAFQTCDDLADAHYADLQALGRELAALRRRDGSAYRLVALPLPAPIHDETGRRLPAGYANFLILNGAVLVPTYADAHDAEALEKLRGCFPDREVIGIDCRALIRQYGSLHCVSMQIPASAVSAPY